LLRDLLDKKKLLELAEQGEDEISTIVAREHLTKIDEIGTWIGEDNLA
jgi:hypothetical protein